VKDYTVLKAFLFSKYLICNKTSAFTTFIMQLVLLINFISVSIFLLHRRPETKIA